MTVGKIESIPIRQAFPHEAHNFTVWLEENIDALSDRLGFELIVEEREKSVGSFNVDLFCVDEYGNNVIVENQLERTDHTHLGQLLTYLVNLDAQTAIWISPEVRPEHMRVIDWLNENTSEDLAFYVVQVEAIRIGDSSIAPLFTILAQPDQQIREIGKAKKASATQDAILRYFWSTLLEASQNRFDDFNHLSPPNAYEFGSSAGLKSIALKFNVFRDGYGGQIYIDGSSMEDNKRKFDELYQYREQIETEIGFVLDWDRLNDKKLSKVRYLVETPSGYDFNTPETWHLIHEPMIEMMIPFSKVMRKYIKKLKLS
jgi:hypothetical protein